MGGPRTLAGRCQALVPGNGQSFSLLFLILSIWSAYETGAQSAAVEPTPSPQQIEYGIKAAYLFNFAKFVEWPDEALPDNGTFRVCVLGQDPLSEALDSIRGRSVQGRRIQINLCTKPADAADCQILFIGDLEQPQLQRILASVRDRPLLTVGDMDGFAGLGGVICFVSEGDKVRFQVNTAAAERAELKINSRLLALAQKVIKRLPKEDF